MIRHGVRGAGTSVEPCGPFPSAARAEVRTLRLQSFVERRCIRWAAGRALLEREAHRVLVLVDLDCFVDRVLRGGELLISPTVDRPDVDCRPTVENPLGDCFAGTATLRDAEAERVAVEEVAQTTFGSEVRVAIGCVRDRAIDHACDAGLAEQRHSFAGVEDLRFQSLEVFAPQLVGELIGNVVAPHRRCLPLVRPKDEAVAFLAQVVTGVGVTQQRQRGSARRELGDLFGDVVLVRHVRDRQVAADQAHHLAGAIAGRVDDYLAVDDVLLASGCARCDRPRVVRVLHQADDSLEAADTSAHRSRSARQRLCDLRRIDVAIEWIP